jgi:hypothetical protein
MKKLICLLMAFAMMFSLCACGGGTSSASEKPDDAGEAANESAEVTEESMIDDESWDALESMGKVETENGLLFVTITLPEGFVGEDVTQESIDANAGDTYTSGKVNEDGSVTYKMTKKQHKAMLDHITEEIEESLQELVSGGEYAFTNIDHNKDFTTFDVTLSTDEVGLQESFMTLGFYLYGGLYGAFTGIEAENITVNYYGPNGDLISTANSADAAQ